MRIRAFLLCLALAALACGPAPALAQNPSGPNPGQEDIAGLGYIDWVNQRAAASGYGVPKDTSSTSAQANISARRAAVVDARRNLLEVVKKVRIDSATRVENLMAVSDAVTSRVNGIIQYSRIVGEQRKPDGSFVVAVSVPLVGELASELLSSGAMGLASRPADPGLEQRLAALEEQLAAMAQRLAELESATQAKAEAPPAAAAPLDTPYAGPYTGLVVDARGTGFKPCLRPRILGPDPASGQALYPGPGVDEAVAVRQGFVRYYRDLAQAQQSAVAGHTPRTVKALPATMDGDLRVSDQDAELLRQAMAAPGSFLSTCKVVVVF